MKPPAPNVADSHTSTGRQRYHPAVELVLHAAPQQRLRARLMHNEEPENPPTPICLLTSTRQRDGKRAILRRNQVYMLQRSSPFGQDGNALKFSFVCECLRATRNPHRQSTTTTSPMVYPTHVHGPSPSTLAERHMQYLPDT